ncbi:MAG: hypothetical protein KBF42_03155 [Chitinophagales bacterium]|jgi:hypothetical protein|nr:hypothetical protein [Bacteroidota bacterium]MBP8916403.1 hypothetical protein [Chitinophagales bacterium]MBP9220356.1 hypothetical protein [Chitinophagales bacterium]MBP9796037.1 hypothetical protein [Chitinophagales bacterium]
MKPTLLLICFAVIINFCKAQPIVDHRIYQSAVKSQANRGTCTAFGLCAAMETFPGFPSDLSEQYLYAMAKSYSYSDETDYDEGTFLKNYIDLMQYQGTLREDQEPYNPDKVKIDTSLSNFENMKSDIAGTSLLKLLSFQDFSYKLQPEMYIYKEGDGARDINYIKKMLDDGKKAIVISYSLNGHYWSSNSGEESEKIDPNDFLVYYDEDEEYSFNAAVSIFGDKVFEPNSEIYYTDTIYRIDGGHAVSIVGYDADGFLVKNSWDDDWGDDGYFWISFNYHKLYAHELMIPILGKVYVDPSVNDLGGWTSDQFWLKSLPHQYDSESLNMHTKSISLSVVYHGNSQMPRFSQIEYLVYDANNKLIDTYYGGTQGIFDGRETGYETYILQQSNNSFPSANKIVANFKTDSGKSFTNTYYNISAVNKEYAPVK